MTNSRNKIATVYAVLKRYPLFSSQFIIVSISIAIITNVITSFSQTAIRPQILFALTLMSALSLATWSLLIYRRSFKQTSEIDKQIEIIEEKQKSGLITQEEARACYRQLIGISIENIALEKEQCNHAMTNTSSTIKQSKGGCNG